MLGNNASRDHTPPPQTWLNLWAWAILSVLGMTSWARKDWWHHWLMGGKAVQDTTLPAPDAPVASPYLPDLLPFPLQLPSPEQLALWREQLITWGPIVAVWSLLGVAALGTVWLLLTVLLRLLIWRPRSAGRFTFTQAQEIATQTLLLLVALGILASAYFLPLDYLTGVIPLGIFVGFCSAVPGEKGWYSWGRLFAEWREDLRWYRRLDQYSIPYEPAESEPELPGINPAVVRLRKKLEKVDAQLTHRSTHPNQREAARHARKMLLDRIAAIERGDEGH